MTQQEIIAGNKMIAEFMDRYKGYPIEDCEDPIKVRRVESQNYATDEYETRPFTYSDLKYHTSWDWLMPVVKKIEQLGFLFEFTRFCDDKDAYYCTISEIDAEYLDIKRDRNNHPVHVVYRTSNDKIVAAYKAVIEFLTWYNSQAK